MVRLGKFRTFLYEIAESPKIEKLSFILPFFVIVIDVLLIEHAIRIDEPYIIFFTTLLFFLSLFEIIVVTGEIHSHYQENTFQRILTIKLDDFILERKQKNVKTLVEEFILFNPKYSAYRNDIYRIICQIMETHKEEAWEKALTDQLRRFIKRRKKMNVDDVFKAFIKKYPTYRKRAGVVYKKICQIKGLSEPSNNNNQI